MRHFQKIDADNHGTWLSIARSCGAVGLHPGATDYGGSETERLQLKHGVEDPGLYLMGLEFRRRTHRASLIVLECLQ